MASLILKSACLSPRMFCFVHAFFQKTLKIFLTVIKRAFMEETAVQAYIFDSVLETKVSPAAVRCGLVTAKVLRLPFAFMLTLG